MSAGKLEEKKPAQPWIASIYPTTAISSTKKGRPPLSRRADGQGEVAGRYGTLCTVETTNANPYFGKVLHRVGTI